MDNKDFGYMAAMIQLAAQAKAVDEAGALWHDLMDEAQKVFDKSSSNIVEARIVSFNQDEQC